MLNKKQQKCFQDFYGSTHKNEFIEDKTAALIGLAAALALNCSPCTKYYLELCKKHNTSKGEINDVLAKVMAVAAGQKNAQFREILKKYQIEF